MSNKIKTVTAIILFIVLAGVIVFQFMRLTKPTLEGGRIARPKVSKELKKTSAEEEKEKAEEAEKAVEAEKPAEKPEEKPAEEVAGQPKSREAKEGEIKEAKEIEAKEEVKEVPVVKEEAKELGKVRRPKSSLVASDIEERFWQSRFFEKNNVIVQRDPFIPPATASGKPPFGKLLTEPTEVSPTGQTGATVSPMPSLVPSEGGEIPLLPLPEEPIAPTVKIVLLGISSGSQSTTALFATTDQEGALSEKFLARPGWFVGQDYIFLGVKNGTAELLDTRTNKITYLSTGGSV